MKANDPCTMLGKGGGWGDGGRQRMGEGGGEGMGRRKGKEEILDLRDNFSWLCVV